MAMKYYKSATPDGGAIGDELTDGGVDDLLPGITSQDRLNGLTILRKIWYESDIDANVLCSLANQGQYNSCFFESANADDTVSDLTGNEDKYGALEIISNTVNTVKVKNDPNETLIRVNDKAHIGTDVVSINSITDNGDGTSDIEFSPDIADADHGGSFLVSCIEKSFSAGDQKPFWIKVVVPELAPMNSTLDTHEFFALY